MVLLNDKFESGTIMRNLMKLRGIKFLTILMVVMLAWTVVIAEQTDIAEQADKEVLTELEQRMRKRISINFSNTPIDDVLRIIADQANMNIIKSPKVVGDVTATLTDVPLEEVLNNILTSHGYGYVMDKNMIRVAPLEDIATVDERLTNRIYRIYYANVTEVEKALSKFISQRGSLSSSPSTSNIIVTDTETKIKAIDKFIEEIDRITPQILVEVRIYDITVRDTLDLGVEWQVGRNTTYDSTDGITTIGTDPTGETLPFITGLFTNPTSETGSSTTGVLRLGWLNPHVDIDIAIKAQQENSNAKLLANPRIMVLDNETATFEIIREIPYTEQTTTAAGTDTQTVQFKDVGVELKVTPHVTRDGMVRLHIIPEFGVVAGTHSEGAAPTVDTRKVDTITLVKDGQTVVLGGLRKKDVSQQINKIPLLGDIPLLGALFRFEGEDTTNSEIVVFITPWIITQPALSETELQQLEVTEFSGPKPASTWVETSKK